MKHLLSTLVLVLIAVTAQAQSGPYISYSNTYNNVQAGTGWDIGSDIVKLNSFAGLSDNYMMVGSGIDVTSGELLGVDIFLGADVKFATSMERHVMIGSPKAGFTIPFQGSRFNIYTSFNQYGFERTKWVPVGVSFRF